MFTYPERQAIASSMAEEHFRINSHTPEEKEAFIAGVVAGIGLIERVDAQNALETVSDRIAKKETPTARFAEEHQETAEPENPQRKVLNFALATDLPRTEKEVSGAITYRMDKRWLPHFIEMLKTMQSFGNAGHSGYVAFYSDGDGDFHPTFNFYLGNTPVEKLPEPLEEPAPKKKCGSIEAIVYDAG